MAETIIVTGGSSGIGLSLIKILINKNYKVINLDLKPSGIDNVIEFLGDISQYQFLKNTVSSLEINNVSIYGLVNNAGISQKGDFLYNLTEDDINKVIQVNLMGTIYLTSLVLPLMLKNGKGSIVNVASVIGKVGAYNNEVYAASKSALIGFTKSLAVTYASRGIRANVILPGYVETPLIEKAAKSSPNETAFYKELASRHPLQRIGKPEEVAKLIEFLLSDNSSFITGSEIPVDGGYLAR